MIEERLDLQALGLKEQKYIGGFEWQVLVGRRANDISEREDNRTIETIENREENTKSEAAKTWNKKHAPTIAPLVCDNT
jgi:hypothetical protein